MTAICAFATVYKNTKDCNQMTSPNNKSYATLEIKYAKDYFCNNVFVGKSSKLKSLFCLF